MALFEVKFTTTARDDAKKAFRKQPHKKKKARKALKLLSEVGPDYPSLCTHQMQGRKIDGDAVWISYVENKTPGAWRIHWMYWGRDTIRVLYLGPHT